MRKFMPLSWLAILLMLFFLGSWCPSGLALPANGEPDLSALSYGVPRDEVLAKMGLPQSSLLNDKGQIVDTWDVITYQFQEIEPSPIHSALDTATFGLWKATSVPWLLRSWVSGMASPMEIDRTREEHKVFTVTYDEDNRIHEVAIDMSHRGEFLFAF